MTRGIKNVGCQWIDKILIRTKFAEVSSRFEYRKNGVVGYKWTLPSGIQSHQGASTSGASVTKNSSRLYTWTPREFADLEAWAGIQGKPIILSQETQTCEYSPRSEVQETQGA